MPTKYIGYAADKEIINTLNFNVYQISCGKVSRENSLEISHCEILPYKDSPYFVSL